MSAPEDIQQIFKRNHCGIKYDLGNFGVAGGASADLFIGWIFNLPAGITGDHTLYAFQILKDRFNAPKAAGAEGYCFEFFGHLYSYNFNFK